MMGGLARNFGLFGSSAATAQKMRLRDRIREFNQARPGRIVFLLIG